MCSHVGTVETFFFWCLTARLLTDEEIAAMSLSDTEDLDYTTSDREDAAASGEQGDHPRMMKENSRPQADQQREVAGKNTRKFSFFLSLIFCRGRYLSLFFTFLLAFKESEKDIPGNEDHSDPSDHNLLSPHQYFRKYFPMKFWKECSGQTDLYSLQRTQSSLSKSQHHPNEMPCRDTPSHGCNEPPTSSHVLVPRHTNTTDCKQHNSEQVLRAS